MKQIYHASCIEDGERFVSIFQTKETNRHKLYEIGQELASDWGGECISVKLWKPKVRKMAKVYDEKSKKWIQNTRRKIENFMARNPKHPRYNWDKNEYFEIKDEVPKDVFDYDVPLAKQVDLQIQS